MEGWSWQQTAAWFNTLAFADLYRGGWEAQRIDGSMLLHLDDSDLRDEVHYSCAATHHQGHHLL